MLFRAITGLLVVVLVATTVLRLASAAPREGVAHCCCGDHGLADECGCPDCPAERDRRGPAQTTLDRCFVVGDSALTVLFPVFQRQPPPALAPRRPPARGAALAPPDAMSDRASDPPLEPPR